jgi:NAD(P)-dependent dehydrogenase (short-subunit alcohol dehydrogenase family)
MLTPAGGAPSAPSRKRLTVPPALRSYALMLLENKRIIVTGGASGIGAATVRAYTREGARVVSLDINDGVAVAQEAGRAATFMRCDIADRRQVFDTFERAVGWLGGLDAMANVAGVERRTPAEDIPDDEWDLIFDVNVKGTLYTNQAAFRHLRDGGGRIINFGSGAGIRGQAGSAHYSASKGAVMAWTRTIAQEWARYRITVNSVVPAIWTPMYDAWRARMSDQERMIHDMAMQHVVPLGGKLGDPDADAAPIMVFLASNLSHFMTGQCFAVDGGMIMLG